MSTDEARTHIGKLVMTTDPGYKLIRAVKPHGPYKLLRITKGGKAVLEGYEHAANTGGLTLYEHPYVSAPDPIMAGLSFLTAFNLKLSEDEYIGYSSAQAKSNGKWAGFILTPEGRVYVNSEPRFESSEEAEAHMRKVVQACRDWDGAHPGSLPTEGTVTEKPDTIRDEEEI